MSWLWKGDTSSPASFEKALSKISTQITEATLVLDSHRARSRRFKALWTLYTVLTYLLYTLVIVLVLGPQNWAIPHYAGLIAAPVVIYLIRRGISMFFEWRIARQQSYLEGLQKQRETKITELKRATKYDSTQELLQKYGGAPKQTPSKPQQGTKRKINLSQNTAPARTGIAPPPTANIPGRNPVQFPSTPQQSSINSPNSARPVSAPSGYSPSPPVIEPDEPGFAPNAFSNPDSIARSPHEQNSHWYDRILDVLLGEDETLAKNRLALICLNCRLVNGQAPPGVKTLEQVGKWRCSSCGAWNGVESATTKAVREMVEEKVEEDSWEKTSRHEETAPGDRGKNTGAHDSENAIGSPNNLTESDDEETSAADKEVADVAEEHGTVVENAPVSKGLRKRKAKQ